MNLFEEARGLGREITELRHYFHQNAEVGRDLPLTTAKIKQTLDTLGIPYEEIIPSGIVARIGRGEKHILLRADTDALPMSESTGLPFASKNPNAMHACGHDTHAAMLLGCAMLLKAHESELGGRVTLMFQPDEEGITGAKAMIDAGLLNDKPDHAFAFHIMSDATLETGTIVLLRGTVMASCDRFTVTVRGSGGHGASPQECINPIYPSLKIIEALTDACRFEISPQLPSVLTVCQISGGTAHNIIPDVCQFRGTLRMLDEQKRAEMLARMKDITRRIATAYRAEGDMVIEQSVPSVQCDDALLDRIHGWLSTDLPDAKLTPIARSTIMGSEDFSFLTQAVPSVFAYIASRSPEGRHYPAHNERVEFDDQTLWQGAAAYAQVAVSYLKSE